MNYKFLTKIIQKRIDDYVRELEIDVNELDSYKYSPSQSWNFVYNPEPAEESWDEDEELKAQYELFRKYMEDDSISDYIDVDDELKKMGYDEDSDNYNDYYKAIEELTKEAAEYCDECVYRLGY